MYLPGEIQLEIDSYYNKYRVFYSLVLYDIYNPYKTRYNEIVKQLSGDSIYTGKMRWLKLEEYRLSRDMIIIRKILRGNPETQNGVVYYMGICDLETGVKTSVFPENNSNWSIQEINHV